jgi:hypothetical protein
MADDLWLELARERAKQVYWRRCSICGDVDRNSLARAMANLAGSVAEAFRQLYPEGSDCELPTDKEIIAWLEETYGKR